MSLPDAADDDFFFELQTKGNITNLKIEKQAYRLEVLDKKVAEARARVEVLGKGRRDKGGKGMAMARAALLEMDEPKQSKPKTGVLASQENTKTQFKVIRVLEHRLNRLRQREDTVGEDSADIRRSIDNMRRRRMQLDSIFEKVTNDLTDQENNMRMVMEQSNDLYHELEELESTKHKLEMDDEDEKQELKDKSADLRRQVFEAKREAAEKRQRMVMQQMSVEGGVQLGDLDNAEEDAIKSRTVELGVLIKHQREEIAELDARIRPMDEAFSTLMHDTKVYDIDELIKQLIREEREIYSNFSYLQHMNRDITLAEAKLHEVRKMKEDFAMLQTKHVTDSDSKMRDKQQERNRIVAIADEMQLRQSALEAEAVEQLMKVKSIYTSIGCRPEGDLTLIDKETGAPVDDWDPVGDGLTEETVRKYLGTIEQRVTQMLGAFVRVLQKAAKPGTRAEVERSLARSPASRDTGSERGHSAGHERASSFRGGKSAKNKEPPTITEEDVQMLQEKLRKQGPMTMFETTRRGKWHVQLPATAGAADDADPTKADAHASPERPLTSVALKESAVAELEAGHIMLESRKVTRSRSQKDVHKHGKSMYKHRGGGGRKHGAGTSATLGRDRAGSRTFESGTPGAGVEHGLPGGRKESNPGRPKTGAAGADRMARTSAW